MIRLYLVVFGFKFGTANSVKYQLSIYSVVSISASSYSFD
jgi:hypothetical protein